MQTKLTLRMDKALIDDAKRISAKSGKSLSKLVADYFQLLGLREPLNEKELSPRTRRLYGVAAGAKVDERDYRRYLEKKYK
ncbi:DUF6364 family protein [bacterium]|nr:DUF6364 family protein [bacterium]